MAPIVTKRPEILIGVKGSWNTRPAAEIVTTSLKIPAMDNVTTEVRWSKANSEDVMQNAMTPGKRMMTGASRGPLLSKRMRRPCQRAGKPSTGIAIRNKDANMMGAR